MIFIGLIAQAAETLDPMAAAPGIGAGALAFMLTCMGAVTLLTIWCFYRITTTRKHFDPDGTGPARSPIAGEVEPEKDR